MKFAPSVAIGIYLIGVTADYEGESHFHKHKQPPYFLLIGL